MKILHTVSIHVTNKAGVLSRITQVFARRSFNIDSLIVSPGIAGKFSRMTITARGEKKDLIQIFYQLSKLIDVVHCSEHTDDDSINREIALIKIICCKEEQAEIVKAIKHFDCKTAEITTTSMIIEATESTDKLDALIKVLENYQIIEIIRTGKIVMACGNQPT